MIPAYRCATPTDLAPFSKNAVSSSTSTASGSPGHSTTNARTRSRNAFQLHRVVRSRSLTLSGLAWPMYAAICQVFFRSTVPSSAFRYARAVSRGSARQNKLASVAKKSSNHATHISMSRSVSTTETTTHPLGRHQPRL